MQPCTSQSNPGHRIIILALAAIVMGCPSATTTPITITEVTVDGSAEATQFDLIIAGRGFGLTSVQYDLQKKVGKATATAYQIRIIDQFGQVHAQTSGDRSVKIESPTQITATFFRTTPLEPGTYGVDIIIGEERRPAAELRRAFDVGDLMGSGPDAGPNTRRDATGPMDTGVAFKAEVGADAGVGPQPDSGPGPGPVDGGPGGQDATPVTGDAMVGDSGLGAWVGSYTYRQRIDLVNPTPAASPTGLTVRIPVPHGQLVSQGRAQADGSDLAIYMGTTRLDHQWDDRTRINSDNLVIVARLNQAIAPGAHVQPPLVLYAGDPMAIDTRTDGVFELAERFAANPPGSWFRNSWTVRCFQRGDTGQNVGSVCVTDDNNNPTRRTIASPQVSTLRDGRQRAANEIYEMSAWIIGVMQQQTDILYFSYSDENDNLTGSTLLPDSAYLGLVPNGTTTFQETGNGGLRTVRGWRMPQAPGMPWTRVRGRFAPDVDRPSMQFRYVSPNGVDDRTTLVGLDDLWVRRALEPDFTVSLGRAETR